jgi:hypothetical protein
MTQFKLNDILKASLSGSNCNEPSMKLFYFLSITNALKSQTFNFFRTG